MVCISTMAWGKRDRARGETVERGNFSQSSGGEGQGWGGREGRWGEKTHFLKHPPILAIFPPHWPFVKSPDYPIIIHLAQAGGGAW